MRRLLVLALFVLLVSGCVKAPTRTTDLKECQTRTIQDDKDNCYRELAASQGNISLCQKVLEPQNRRWCTGLLTNDSGLCRAIEDPMMRDWCYDSIAKAAANQSICYDIQAAGQRNLCYNAFKKP